MWYYRITYYKKVNDDWILSTSIQRTIDIFEAIEMCMEENSIDREQIDTVQCMQYNEE